MGYKSPYNKVGKVMPEMKNQSKSSLMMNDASPLYETDLKTKRQEYMAKRESDRVEKARKADAIKERVQNRRMEKTIARDKAINERRAAVIERRKQKDPNYKYKKEGTATGQQHLQSSVTPLEMHGAGGSHPDTDPELTKKEGKAETSVSTSGDTTTTTTIQRVSGTGKKGGFVSGTSYDLDEVIVGLDTDSSSSTKQKPKSRRKNPSLKRKTYSKAGNFFRGINPLSTKHERVRARTRLGQDRLL